MEEIVSALAYEFAITEAMNKDVAADTWRFAIAQARSHPASMFAVKGATRSVAS